MRLFLSSLAAVATSLSLTETFGFDPKMITKIPPGTIAAVGRYLKPEVVARFAAQVKINPPVELHTPGRQVALTKQELVDSFEMAYMSFCPGKRVIDMECICNKEYKDIVEINNDISQASAIVAAFPRKRTIVVSYAFTRSLRNWLTNLDAAAIPMPGAPRGVKVHYGIYQHYMSIHNQTMDAVSSLLAKYRGYKVFATGYSLGASIAVMAVPSWHEFKKTHDTHVQVASYSGPRTGNLAAKLYFESLGVPITRYTNQNDIVTMLPPRSLDYVHAGVEVYEYATASGGTEFVTCRQDYDEDPQCQWRERNNPTVLRHPFPLNSFVPLPPYCNRNQN